MTEMREMIIIFNECRPHQYVKGQKKLRMSRKRLFPMFIDLSDKEVLVIGGGPVAHRRISTLLQFTRKVTVVAQKADKEIREMSRLGQIRLEMRPLRRSDFSSAYMVIATTNDRKLNDDIFRICRSEGVYVNIASDRDKCDFYFPGVYMTKDLVVGVTASGINREKASRIRDEIDKALNKIENDIEQ